MKLPFSYRLTKDGKLIISRDHKQIMIIKGRTADKFISSLAGADEDEIQLQLAKITGHYKHGNER